jgi:hypothetical protein
MKEAGTAHWLDPNVGATNETGFTSLPGGIGFADFGADLGRSARFWGKAETYLCYFKNDTNNGTFNRFVNPLNTSMELGLSVRCVRD